MKKFLLIGFLCSLVFSTVLLADRNTTGAFETIRPPQPTQTADNIEVIEIFWYGCPHCFALEPHLDTWLKDKPVDVEFRRMPGILGKNWIPHARAYLTVEKMGVLDLVHGPLFNALHNEKRELFDDKSLRNFIVNLGVDGKEYDRVISSQEIEDKIKEAFVMGKRYGITGVPSIIVNGKYRTSPSMTGSYNNLVLVMNELIAKERENQTPAE